MVGLSGDSAKDVRIQREGPSDRTLRSVKYLTAREYRLCSGWVPRADSKRVSGCPQNRTTRPMIRLSNIAGPVHPFPLELETLVRSDKVARFA